MQHPQHGLFRFRAACSLGLKRFYVEPSFPSATGLRSFGFRCDFGRPKVAQGTEGRRPGFGVWQTAEVIGSLREGGSSGKGPRDP